MIPSFDAAHRPLDDATDALPNPALEELMAEVEALRERVAELEAENERLKAFSLLDWQTAGTSSGDLRGQGLLVPKCVERAPNNAEQPAPATRPLTTADRLPVEGDGLMTPFGPWRMSPGNVRSWADVGRGWTYPLGNCEYLSRADGGPVTLEVTP